MNKQKEIIKKILKMEHKELLNMLRKTKKEQTLVIRMNKQKELICNYIEAIGIAIDDALSFSAYNIMFRIYEDEDEKTINHTKNMMNLQKYLREILEINNHAQLQIIKVPTYMQYENINDDTTIEITNETNIESEKDAV